YAASPSANSDDAFNGGTFNAFEGMGGDDIITGNGNTRIEYVNAYEPVTVTFTSNQGVVNGIYQGASGIAVGGPSVGTDHFTGVNSVWGTSFGDTFAGSNNPSGVETFAGRGGDDFIDGGGGFDRADYLRDGPITTGITVNLAAGTVTGDPFLTGNDTLRSIEA